MGLNYCVSKLSSFSIDESFRLDARFALFSQIDFVTYWQSSNLYLLKDILKPVSSPIYKKGVLNDEFYLIDLANIGHKLNTLQNLEMVNEIGSDKHFIEDGDLIIPKIEPKKGNFFLNLEHKEFLGSTELIEYKIDIEKYNPVFLYYLLVSEKILKLLSYLESGKTHKRVNTDTLLRQIKIPKIDICKQAMVAQEIGIIEKEITQLKNSKTPTLDIINQVFGEEFGFDWQEFEYLKTQKVFTLKLSDFANNLDCRMGVRFHNIAGGYLQNFLKNISSKKLKDFLDIPIVLGSSISPQDFDEDGDFYYISMATVKNYYFEPEDAQTVSVSYSKSNANKSVCKNDIIMTRSGVAIGKFALIDEDIDGIFADFTMRIRLKSFSPLLAYYYFRSDFFQYLIYTHKKGLQNQNIFPSQIQEFPMPDWDEQKQTQIVQKIKSQLDKQQEIDKQIEEKQRQIEQLIEKAIFE